jgi:hypothetical protein
MSSPSENSLSAAPIGRRNLPKEPPRTGGPLTTDALVRYQKIASMERDGIAWDSIAESLKLTPDWLKTWYTQTSAKLAAELSNDNDVRYGKGGTPVMRAIKHLRQQGHEVVRYGPDNYSVDRRMVSKANLLTRAGLTKPEDLYTEVPYFSYFTLEVAGRYLIDFHDWLVELVWHPSTPPDRQRVKANGVEMTGNALLIEAQQRYLAATGRKIATRCPNGLAHGFSKRAV